MALQASLTSLALCLAFLTLAASKTAPGTVRLTDSAGVEIPHSSCGTTGGFLQVFDGVRWGFVGSSGFGSDVYSKNSVCKQVLCNFGSNAVQVGSVVRPSGSYVAWSDVRCDGEPYEGGEPGLGGCRRRQAGVSGGVGLSDGSVVHMVCGGEGGGVRRGARRLSGLGNFNMLYLIGIVPLVALILLSIWACRVIKRRQQAMLQAMQEAGIAPGALGSYQIAQLTAQAQASSRVNPVHASQGAGGGMPGTYGQQGPAMEMGSTGHPGNSGYGGSAAYPGQPPSFSVTPAPGGPYPGYPQAGAPGGNL